MKLYEVRNGWIGAGPAHVLVIAVSEQCALDVARAQFRALAERWDNRYPISRKGAAYWSNLEVILLCADVSMEWVSDERD